jgi:hypothetical protein
VEDGFSDHNVESFQSHDDTNTRDIISHVWMLATVFHFRSLVTFRVALVNLFVATFPRLFP